MSGQRVLARSGDHAPRADTNILVVNLDDFDRYEDDIRIEAMAS